MLHKLTVRDYRNLVHAELPLDDGFTVVHGHNGAGKTNLLEAIYLVGTLRSFRTTDTDALVRWDAPGAAVEIRALDPALGIPTTLTVRLDRHGSSVRRTAIADGKTIRSAAQFYGRVQAVLFTPEDLGVLRGSPTGRRQFLDRVLFARDRGHIGDVQAYDKLLRSRNYVLRQDAPADERTTMLDAYEAGLADAGARIWTRRTELLHELQAPFSEAFARIHGARGDRPGEGSPAAVALRYDSRLDPAIAPEQRAEALAIALRERRRDDERRGSTSIGPHRDDLVVLLDDRPAGEFASQGQARALVLAFKLAELRAAAELHGHPPLLLLDDVSSELDPARNALLFRTLAETAAQCILTTTAPGFIALPPAVTTRRFRVQRGLVTADGDGSGEPE